LKDGAKDWLGFVRRTGAIVLLAESFGDLILPEAAEGTCSRTKPLEKDHDYLAAPVYMLEGDERQRRAGNDHSKGCLQIDDHTFWNGFNPHAVQMSCACADGEQCSTVSRLGRRARESATELSLGIVNVFEAFRDGAAIIGDPEESRSKKPEAKESEANESESNRTDDMTTATIKRRWKDMKSRLLASLKHKT
jgi:hypothetical protein